MMVMMMKQIVASVVAVVAFVVRMMIDFPFSRNLASQQVAVVDLPSSLKQTFLCCCCCSDERQQMMAQLELLEQSVVFGSVSCVWQRRSSVLQLQIQIPLLRLCDKQWQSFPPPVQLYLIPISNSEGHTRRSAREHRF
jgi:hypothetical protein